MQTTEEKKKNLADAQKKGIPGSQLGPSGKPKVNVVKHQTEKRAKDAARNSGQGKPAKDASPKRAGRITIQPIAIVVERKVKETSIMNILTKCEEA
jgi:hypothetical protein